MAELLIRVRTPEGMLRFKVRPTDTVLHLKQQVFQNLTSNQNSASSGVSSIPPPNELKLSVDQHDSQFLENHRTFSELQLRSGELLNLGGLVRDIGAQQPVADVSSSSSSPAKCSYHGPRGSCVRCMTARMIRISAQDKPKCTGVSLSRSAIERFQSFVFSQLGFSIQRCGLLYGTPPDPEGWISVEYIYEPQQEGSESQILILNPPDDDKKEGKSQQLTEFQRVTMISELCGLQLIGWVISHSGLDYRLSSREMLMVSRFYKQTDPFVSLIISPDETGNVQCEAFELSSQYLELSRTRDVFLPEDQQDDPKVHKTNIAVYMGTKDTTAVDNDCFLVPLPIKDYQSLITTDFPIENRPQYPPVTREDLQKYWKKNRNQPFVPKIADFHLLLFLFNHVDVELMEQIIQLVSAYRRGESGDAVTEGFELILEHVMN